MRLTSFIARRVWRGKFGLALTNPPEKKPSVRINFSSGGMKYVDLITLAQWDAMSDLEKASVLKERNWYDPNAHESFVYAFRESLVRDEARKGGHGDPGLLIRGEGGTYKLPPHNVIEQMSRGELLEMCKSVGYVEGDLFAVGLKGLWGLLEKKRAKTILA